MRIYIKNYTVGILLIIFSSIAQADYTIGDGLILGDAFISGYSKFALESPNGQPAQFVADDLSLFATASITPYINPFIEIEIATAQLWQENQGIGFRGSRLVLERLYNDVHLNDTVNIRLGKSLAPVGEWNRIHAAPLVWTTARPVTSRYSFSESVSGVNVQYTSHNNDVFQAYFQPGSELSPKPLTKNRPRYYTHVSGLSIDKFWGVTRKLGIAVQHAQVNYTGDRQWVFSIDGQWDSTQLDLEFHTTYTDIDFQLPAINQQNEKGGYVQAVWHFNEKWHAIVRPEYFSTRLGESQSTQLYGITFKPQPAISWKVEYIDANRSPDFGLNQGWFASMAVLF